MGQTERIPGELVIRQIEELELQVASARTPGSQVGWGAVWQSIRSTGAMFPEAWFESVEERRRVWMWYQAVVDVVKESQSAAKARRDTFEVRCLNSRLVAEQIVRLAESAWPHEDGFIEFIGTITGAKLLAEVFVGLMELTVRVATFGFLRPDTQDDGTAFLKQCSSKLREAWDLYHTNHAVFVAEDHQAMRTMLLRIQAELQGEWDKLKGDRSSTFTDRVHRKRGLIAEVASLHGCNGSSAGERSQQLEARWRDVGFVGDKAQEGELWQEFREAIDSFWHERKGNRKARLESALAATRANVEKLQASVEHDEGVLQEKEEKIANVFEGRRAAKIRDHLQSVIDDIQEKIERKRGWIEEQEQRIEEMEGVLAELD